MTKRYLIAFLLLCSQVAFGADLVIISANNQLSFRAEVAGRSGTSSFVKRQEFNNLPNGSVNINIEVSQHDVARFQNVELTANAISTYYVTMEDDQIRLVFQDSKPLTATAGRGQTQAPSGNGNNQYQSGNNGSYSNTYGGYNNSGGAYGNSNNGNGYGRGNGNGNGYGNGRGNGYENGGRGDDDDHGYPGGGYQHRPGQPPYGPGHAGPSRPGNHPAASQDLLFRDLLQAVSFRNNDASKMTIIRQALPGLNPTSAQVLVLMQQMNFESTRKDLAIQAYPLVVDPQNYFVLADGFTYASSVNDLANFALSRGPVYSGRYVDPTAFGLGLSAVQKQSFEQTKLLLGRWIIQSMPLESRQVAMLMQAYNYEASRLEIAKAAYPQVLDPQRYFIVNNSFTFESSVRQLESYIYQCGGRR